MKVKTCICSLNELNTEFDALNNYCGNFCKNCDKPDCEGFIWLLEDEANLYESKEIDTIVLNDDICFISCLKKECDDLSNIINPKCIYRCKETKKCTIHDIRPLTCHMYPIGPETINGKNYWIVHTECDWIQYLLKKDKANEYIKCAKALFNRIDKRLYSKIVSSYEKMNSIAVESEMNENEYRVIIEM